MPQRCFFHSTVGSQLIPDICSIIAEIFQAMPDSSDFWLFSPVTISKKCRLAHMLIVGQHVYLDNPLTNKIYTSTLKDLYFLLLRMLQCGNLPNFLHFQRKLSIYYIQQDLIRFILVVPSLNSLAIYNAIPCYFFLYLIVLCVYLCTLLSNISIFIIINPETHQISSFLFNVISISHQFIVLVTLLSYFYGFISKCLTILKI